MPDPPRGGNGGGGAWGPHDDGDRPATRGRPGPQRNKGRSKGRRRQARTAHTEAPDRAHGGRPPGGAHWSGPGERYRRDRERQGAKGWPTDARGEGCRSSRPARLAAAAKRTLYPAFTLGDGEPRSGVRTGDGGVIRSRSTASCLPLIVRRKRRGGSEASRPQGGATTAPDAHHERIQRGRGGGGSPFPLFVNRPARSEAEGMFKWREAPTFSGGLRQARTGRLTTTGPSPEDVPRLPRRGRGRGSAGRRSSFRRDGVVTVRCGSVGATIDAWRVVKVGHASIARPSRIAASTRGTWAARVRFSARSQYGGRGSSSSMRR